MALAVPYRLWLGGVVSPVRDLGLIQRLVDLVRLAWRPGRTLLIGVDGLASYVTAFWRAFREKVHTGRRGRPPYRLPRGVLLGQVVKSHSGRRLVGVVRRAVWGSPGRIDRVLQRTGTGRQINTSYIERLNATFRSRLASLVRRGRGLAHRVETLECGMYLVGCVYNFCTEHRSLRVSVPEGTTKWQGRTPAMAARWTDHVWSVQELLVLQGSHGPSRLSVVLPRNARSAGGDRSNTAAHLRNGTVSHRSCDIATAIPRTLRSGRAPVGAHRLVVIGATAVPPGPVRPVAVNWSDLFFLKLPSVRVTEVLPAPRVAERTGIPLTLPRRPAWVTL